MVTGPTGGFAGRLRTAMDRADASPEWLSAQLHVRGVRVSTDTVRGWCDGTMVPSPSVDRRALTALDALLPGARLLLDVDDLSRGQEQWRPHVALPASHPARARLLAVRQVVEQHFVVEVCHDSSIVLDDPRVMERTIRLVARPVAARRSDPGVWLTVPTGSRVEVVNGTGRERLSDAVAIGDGFDLVHLTRRRTSTTRPGRLQTAEYQVRITAPTPVTALRFALPEPVELFTMDVTLPQAPEAALVLHRSEFEAAGSRTALDAHPHLQFSTADAPLGIYDLMWGDPRS